MYQSSVKPEASCARCPRSNELRADAEPRLVAAPTAANAIVRHCPARAVSNFRIAAVVGSKHGL